MSRGGYPLGAEFDPRAPWKEKEPKQVEVTVDLTLIIVRKIVVEVDENYDETEIENAIDDVMDNIKIIDNQHREWFIDNYEIEEYFE